MRNRKNIGSICVVILESLRGLQDMQGGVKLFSASLEPMIK